MYVRVTASPNSPRKSVKVVASVRDGLKVKQVMIHHVGVGSNEGELKQLKQLGLEYIARKQMEIEATSGQGCLFEPKTLEARIAQLKGQEGVKQRQKLGRNPTVKLADVTAQHQLSLLDLTEEKRVIEGIHDVAGHVYDQMGYNTILSSLKDQTLLRDMVLMRLANPTSKRQTQQLLDKHFAKVHDLDAMYRLMDKVYPQIPTVKTKTFLSTQKLLPETVDILFFDCTTLYFESMETDELRQFGYSKDHRFNTTQVVLALATNSAGLPVGYELFEGNKAEVKTLLSCLDTWQQSFSIGTVCFVADRAMMSKDNLNELQKSGHQYVVAAKLRQLPKKLQDQFFVDDNYQPQQMGQNFGWIGEFTYQTKELADQRLVVSYKTDRARRDAYQRQQIVEKIQKKMDKQNKGETKTFITNQGVKKYTKSENASIVLDQAKIMQDAKWDGLHGIITNIKDQDAATLLARYARLWKIEESFRINKHTLSMRPIYHFKPERIHAHIAISYMAFSVLRHMEYVVQLTQKISPQTMLDTLMDVQASFYRHLPTGRLYRMPGRFPQEASKIYKAFQIQRCNHAQMIC